MLPEFMLLVVFKFLALADVCRARVVCKIWNRLIIEAGMQNWEVIYRDDGKLWCPRTGEQKTFSLTDECGNQLTPLASCNGLLLCKLRNSRCTLKVGNPLTGKWKDLPLFPLPFPDLDIPASSAWKGRAHLLVDPESASAHFKVTVLPRGSWRGHPLVKVAGAVTIVLQFNSVTGEWTKSDGLRLVESDKIIRDGKGWKVNPRCIVTGWYHVVVFDIDELSWSGFKPALPFPEGNSWWSGMQERWFEFRTSVDYIWVQGLGWVNFACHVYQGGRIIGAGIFRDQKYAIGFAALELQRNMQWTRLCSITFGKMFGKSDLKFVCPMGFIIHGGYPGEGNWTMMNNSTIYWWPFEVLPPVAYDIETSTWSSWNALDHSPQQRGYSLFTLNRLVSP